MARAFVGDTGEGESALNWYREKFHIHPFDPYPHVAEALVVAPFPLDTI